MHAGLEEKGPGEHAWGCRKLIPVQSLRTWLPLILFYLTVAVVLVRPAVLELQQCTQDDPGCI